MIVNLEKPRIFFSGSYVVLKVLMNDLIGWLFLTVILFFILVWKRKNKYLNQDKNEKEKRLVDF